jgi:hypothetical protein
MTIFWKKWAFWPEWTFQSLYDARGSNYNIFSEMKFTIFALQITESPKMSKKLHSEKHFPLKNMRELHLIHVHFARYRVVEGYCSRFGGRDIHHSKGPAIMYRVPLEHFSRTWVPR